MDCLHPSCTVSYLFRMLLRGSSSESVGQSISPMRSSAYTGCAFRSGSPLRTCRPDTPSHPRHRTIHLQSCFTHRDMTSRQRLRSFNLSTTGTGSAAGSIVSLLYCRQAGVPSFWSYRMEQFTTSRRHTYLHRLSRSSSSVSRHFCSQNIHRLRSQYANWPLA